MTEPQQRVVRTNDGRPGPNQPTKAAGPWLSLAAFVGGASVMLVEIVGTRVLTPLFGVGLYVWSALLGVTLGSLALGYYVGGVLADTRSKFALPVQLIAAGLLLSMTPFARVPLLLALSGMEPRLGALTAATLLFGPTLCVLGMVSTTAVKLAIQASHGTGRAAGRVYALSTIGSLLGTLAAGFWFVPNYPVTHILMGTAAMLMLVGVSGLRAARRLTAGLGVVGLMVLLGVIPEPTVEGSVEIVARRQTPYGSVAVVRDAKHGTALTMMKADHSLIGAQWATGEPAFAFVHILEAGRLARPMASRALVIGLGIGSAATALANAGMIVDIVELDPAVVDLAQEHFGFVPNGDVFTEDARTLIGRTDRRYDLIIHDTFTGGVTPEHLLSLEVMQQLSKLLTQNGVLTLNVVGAVTGPLSAATLAVRRTMGEAFAHVRAFRDGPIKGDNELHNTIFFASEGPIRFAPVSASAGPASQRESVLMNFQQWEVLQTVAPGAIITDEHNPIARLSAPVTQRFHEEMNELYPPGFWLQ